MSVDGQLAGHDARADAAGFGAHRLGGVQRLVHALAEWGDGLFDVVDRGAELKLPYRDDDAVGAEVPEEGPDAAEVVGVLGLQSGHGIDDAVLTLGAGPADVR